MARLSASILALLLGTAAALLLASCGGGDSSGLLAGSTASEINSNIDQVEELIAEGDCTGAAEASQTVSAQVEELNGVNARLKEALGEGAARLAEFVSTCEEAPSEAEEDEALKAAEDAEAELEEKDSEKKQKVEKPEKEKGREKEQKEAPAEEATPPSEEPEEAAPPSENEGGNSGGVGPAAPAGGE